MSERTPAEFVAAICADMGPLLKTDEGELAQLMHNSRGRVLCHTWGEVNGGIIWCRCPWTIAELLKLRGVEISAEIAEAFANYKA